ncbi:TetR family transcriptional regulator [Streptomyces sp. NPDC001652]|uniref:TetR/AcrR family transcriptional regulator n=1 Tax=Streptomyces sp. NPDC001652 TaxID=3154393 RepID=UPI003331442D
MVWHLTGLLAAAPENEHKQATRQRIIETAGRRFKRDGIDTSGVSTLMKDAGLTNGAFYTHFTSKDDLVATTVTNQLQAQNAGIVTQATPGRAGLEQIVRRYLSAWHRDSPGDGCPSAALLDEIARRTDPTKQAYTHGVLLVIDGIAARMAPGDPLTVCTRTLSDYAMMAGDQDHEPTHPATAPVDRQARPIAPRPHQPFTAAAEHLSESSGVTTATAIRTRRAASRPPSCHPPTSHLTLRA